MKRLLKNLSLLFFGLVFVSTVCFTQDLVINEFVTSNSTGIVDEDGDHEDWIELMNIGAVPINLANFGISDDITFPNKWEFPTFMLLPGEYLLIFASGKDRVLPNFHTNFKISSTGEDLYITNSIQTVLDYIPPTTFPSDISYGRSPNGVGTLNFFQTTTPGSENIFGGFEELLDSPTLSHYSGFYDDSFYLKVYHNDPDVIFRYTLNGEIPTASSPLFPDSLLIDDISTQPDNISSLPTTSLSVPTWYRWYPPMDIVFKGVNIRIRSFKINCISLHTLTAQYFVHDGMEDRYELPIVSLTLPQNSLLGPQGIYTNFNQTGLNWERDVHIKFFEPTGAVGFETDAGIRLHGGNSRRYALKSFRLYFRKLYGLDSINYPVLQDDGLDIYERLILRNSGSDWSRSYYRDAFVQDILQGFTTVDHQGFQPSITFLNGEYWGVMNLRGRYDDNYIRLKYNVEQFDLLENSNSVVYGSNSHYNSLISYMQMNDMDDEVHYTEVQTRMDVENFRDYHILQVFAMNTDQPGKNVRFWKSSELDNKWRWMWFDLDDTFLIGPHTEYTRNGLAFCVGLDSISDMTPNGQSTFPAWAPNGVSQTFPLRSLLGSTTFRTNFINRFGDLLNTGFRPDYLSQKIDSIESYFSSVMLEHYRRWHRPEPTFRDDHIQYLYEFSENRQFYMREHITDFFELTGQFETNLEIGSGDGYIHLNTIDIDTTTPSIGYPVYPWSGIYFNDVPINVKAIPRPGYIFSHWDGYIFSTVDSLEISTDENITLIAHFLPDITINNNTIENLSDFTIYPNPASEQLHIRLGDDFFMNGDLSIYDLSGKLVYTGSLTAKNSTIEISTLRPGSYIVKIRSLSGHQINEKLIKL